MRIASAALLCLAVGSCLEIPDPAFDPLNIEDFPIAIVGAVGVDIDGEGPLDMVVINAPGDEGNGVFLVTAGTPPTYDFYELEDPPVAIMLLRNTGETASNAELENSVLVITQSNGSQAELYLFYQNEGLDYTPYNTTIPLTSENNDPFVATLGTLKTEDAPRLFVGTGSKVIRSQPLFDPSIFEDGVSSSFDFQLRDMSYVTGIVLARRAADAQTDIVTFGAQGEVIHYRSSGETTRASYTAIGGQLEFATPREVFAIDGSAADGVPCSTTVVAVEPALDVVGMRVGCEDRSPPLLELTDTVGWTFVTAISIQTDLRGSETARHDLVALTSPIGDSSYYIEMIADIGVIGGGMLGSEEQAEPADVDGEPTVLVAGEFGFDGDNKPKVLTITRTGAIQCFESKGAAETLKLESCQKHGLKAPD